MTKANYHGFINAMNAFVRGRHNRTMIVWGGFDPHPERDRANPGVEKVDTSVVVSPFDSVRMLPWPHRLVRQHPGRDDRAPRRGRPPARQERKDDRWRDQWGVPQELPYAKTCAESRSTGAHC